MRWAIKLDILIDNPEFIAINKPARLSAIPGRDDSISAIEMLGLELNLPRTGAVDPRLRIVHRIDKETSGVLIFAKSAAAQRHLCRQFQDGLVRKEYLALVAGCPTEQSGRIDSPIGPHPSSPIRMAVTKQGKPAVTLWEVERRFRAASLLRVFPQTGRTHQIRVHLKSIGLPLLIDPLYNPMPCGLLLSSFKRGYRAKAGEAERPLIARLTLHAHRLSFMDLNDKPCEVEAALPKDFRAAINMLQKHG